MSEATIVRLDIRDIRIDPALQARVRLDSAVVEQYVILMDNGAQFPPVVVFTDAAGAYNLADGRHRVEAARLLGIEDMAAEVHRGGAREALWYALGANTAHGLQMTDEDRERAAQLALADPEWARLSDREIGRHLGVSHGFVSSQRRKREFTQQQAGAPVDSSVRVDKRGRQMNVGNIGKSGKKAAAAAPPAPKPEFVEIDADLLGSLAMFSFSDRYKKLASEYPDAWVIVEARQGALALREAAKAIAPIAATVSVWTPTNTEFGEAVFMPGTSAQVELNLRKLAAEHPVARYYDHGADLDDFMFQHLRRLAGEQTKREQRQAWEDALETGQWVKTRSGQKGQILAFNGGLAVVRTGSVEHNHHISDLLPVGEDAPPAPGAEPTKYEFDVDDLVVLSTSGSIARVTGFSGDRVQLAFRRYRADGLLYTSDEGWPANFVELKEKWVPGTPPLEPPPSNDPPFKVGDEVVSPMGLRATVAAVYLEDVDVVTPNLSGVTRVKMTQLRPYDETAPVEIPTETLVRFLRVWAYVEKRRLAGFLKIPQVLREDYGVAFAFFAQFGPDAGEPESEEAGS